jgi:hypothetical protein
LNNSEGVYSSGFSKETEPIDIYYMVLAPVIIEAENSHDMPFASWRPRKTAVVQRFENWIITTGIDSSLYLKG